MSSISSKRKWRSSEEIALEYLEELGYRVLDRNYKIVVDGVELGEIDAIVEDSSGVKYAVEIKAGNVDISGVRQAYVNAELLGYKPLIIAKGFADEAAEKLSEELGVKVHVLSDRFIVDPEELETIVYASIKRIVQEILDLITSAPTPNSEEMKLLEMIAMSKTVKDLAENLNTSVEEVAKRIKILQDRGLLAAKTKSFQEMRLQAQIILLREKLAAILRKLGNSV